MEKGPGLGAQAIDQVLQIDAPGPRAMTAAAIDARQLAYPVAAQIHDQPVMVQPLDYLWIVFWYPKIQRHYQGTTKFCRL